MLKRVLNLFKLSGFKIALLITLLILGTFLFNTVFERASFLDLMDKKWVDYILRGRPIQPHTDKVVIATIDKDSIDLYGRWPWSRKLMAQLVRTLNDHYQARTLGFDIVFSEPEESSGMRVTEDYLKKIRQLGLDSGRGKELANYLGKTEQELDADSIFGKELARKRNAVLGYFFRTDTEDIENPEKQKELQESARRIQGSEVSVVQGTLLKGTLSTGLSVESNIDKVFKGGWASGFFNMRPDDEDGTVRRVHVLWQYGENIYPSLDIQILKHYLNVNNLVVTTDETGYIQSLTLGDNVVETNFDGSVMLNYKGPSNTFKQISISDILQEKVPVADIKDKIVLVGATEVGIFDLRTTPVEVNYPGVEVHATLIDNILTKSYFRITFVNHTLTALLILGLGLLLGFTLPNLAGIYGAVVSAALLVVYTLGHRWMVNNLLTWTSFVYVALTIVAVWGGVTLFRFLVTDRDKRFIKNAFQQYLAPEVINQLMDNPDLLQLGGEEGEVTAFFSDVRGFSTVSEKLKPEELVQLMQEYLTEMSNIVMKHGGTIDKYIGDAIVAFFGAPVHYPDHFKRALDASLEMQTRLAQMRDEWRDPNRALPADASGPAKRLAEVRNLWRKEGRLEDMMLYQRIGLNTGPVVVGNMGSESRFNYTMMGNAVNLAARLEGANKFYGTYSMCTEFTYAPAKDAIVGRELDLIVVKGVSKPVRVFEIVGKRGEVPDEKMKGIQYFEKGLELYRKQQWEDAAKHFNAVFKFIPDDPPSKVFIGRCTHFKAQPPQADWNGAYEATEK